MAATLTLRRLVCLPKLCRPFFELKPLKPDTFCDINELPEHFRYWSCTTLGVKKSKSLDCDIVRLHKEGNDSPEPGKMNHFLEYVLYRQPSRRIAKSFLALMLVHGFNPDLRTFFILMRLYCRVLPYQQLNDFVITQMKAMDVKPDDSFCIILMNDVCYHFGPYAGYHLLNKLKSSYPTQIPLLCYHAIVRRIFNRKITEEAVEHLLDVLVDMKLQGIFPDEKFYDFLLSGRGDEGDQDFFKAVAIGRLMFAEGIRFGAVSPIIPDEREGISKKVQKSSRTHQLGKVLKKKCNRW